MSILVNKNTRVVVQGITGKEGVVSCDSVQGLRHAGRGGRDAWKGRAGS